ncbi:tRNA intron endonuclease [Lipomyces arxii]|uniref:tRNA intron endonuclease n=1 Tax=Lipomyces arxii TaxID=56418 RepID=UPI0034CDA86A
MPVDIHDIEPVLISYIDGEYFIFDLDVLKYLRENYHVVGILAGTLPQVPQQNVFLGLPLQLMAEETAFLVNKGVAKIVDEVASHQSLLKPPADGVDDEQVRLKVAELEAAGVTEQNHLQWFTTSLLSTVPNTYISESSVESVYSTPRFLIYKFLNERGYFISPGLRFGAQFVAYPGDPLRYHSHYLVRGVDYNEEFPLLDMVGSGRLGTSVKKAWMIGSQVPTQEDASESEFEGFCIEWAGFG